MATLEKKFFDYLTTNLVVEVNPLEKAESVTVIQSDRQTITPGFIEETSFHVDAIFTSKIDAATASDAVVKEIKKFANVTNMVMEAWIDTEQASRKGLLGKWTYSVACRLRHRDVSSW